MIRSIRPIVAVLAGLVLGACAAPPVKHYYTLIPPSGPESPGGDTATSSSRSSLPFAVSIQPVRVPEQVDRLQIVVTDPQSTQVYPLDNSLWAGSLSDELRQALGTYLYNDLGVRNVAVAQVPENFPLWKIYLSIQRFESLYASRAVIDATWSLVPVNQPRRIALLCGGTATVAVQSGMSALVAGHQSALRELASRMGAQLRHAQATPQTVPNGCVTK